ncbi:MAG: dNTP triphosphohydrolase [Methanosarcina sp.]|uniref:dGTP triphosphohydrolase n=1 Tax=Methanosarcina sp. TaxID=2213 RepID=UPI002601D079|nr:dNTP triphosphohydrolase [Methanosarcina sp.]MDD3245523.1 dNTP triphosphohydrolase [Methanosarcina sp.]MDD4248354.1 dNTP triphosphohydrolase [Methanosarcina sp.]
MDDRIYEKRLDPLATLDKGLPVHRTHHDEKEECEKNSIVIARTPFQRDKDRIIYSKAFRRLIHKTQVCFMGEMKEHIRTRLTHTLEVSQIARSIARQVHANEDLVEAIALGHDLGHTPFGHTGEKVLNDFLTGKDEGIRTKLLKMYGFDIKENGLSFKHNFQSVRVLNVLEEGYKEFEGLNLTDAVLEGILKHTKLESNDQLIVYEGINDYQAFHIEQNFSCSLEGQIVALADEIAQVCHDIEDAIEGNYDSKDIICSQLGSLTSKFDINCLVKDEVKEMIATNQIKYVISCIISTVISEAVVKINKNMADLNKRGLKAEYLNEDIATEKSVLKYNELYQELKEIEENFVINNYMIDRMNGKSRFVLRQIMKAYLTNPKQLPDHVLESYTKVCSVQILKQKIITVDSAPANIRYLNKDYFEKHKPSIIKDRAFLRLMSDYVASMTDFYALQEFQKLYGGNSI